MNRSRYIPIYEMEEITQQILQDYGFPLYSTDIKPVPIDELIEFHFELDILWENIDHLDSQDLVMAAIIPTKRQIVLNETCKDMFAEKMGTMNFTLAHELGHWVLHTGIYDGINLRSRTPFYCRSFNKKPMIEIQADLFAGCLLMPRPIITKLVKQLRWRGSIYLRQLYELADLFQVSISALKVRLEQLELLYIHSDGTVYHSKDDAHVEQLVFDI